VATIPFVEPLGNVAYGGAERLSPLVTRVIAENPSKFTYKGTGTYIIGRDDVVVIDPGPEIEKHRLALQRALDGRRVRGIVVTHCHSDHVPLSHWLGETTGAPTYGIGPHPRPAPSELFDDDRADDELEAKDHGDGEEREHTDFDFVPDVAVVDGRPFLTVDDWTLTAVHTPGHTSNHLCVHLDVENALFTGDHIMGWSTTVVSPPDGNMADYIASLERVRALDPATLWPTHGAPVTDVGPFIDACVAHRLEREAGVLAAVRDGVALVPDMVNRLYVGVNEKLYKAAGRSVLAHLIKLVADGAVTFEGTQPGVTTPYRPT